MSLKCHSFTGQAVKLLPAFKLNQALSELPCGHFFWKSGHSARRDVGEVSKQRMVVYLKRHGGRIWLFRGHPWSERLDREDILAHLRHGAASQKEREQRQFTQGFDFDFFNWEGRIR